MARDGVAPARLLTRRDLLKTVTAAGIGAAASHYFPGQDSGTNTAALAAPTLRRGGTLRIAEVGEPLTLDITITTADLTANITLPIFENLFAFDINWRYQPCLVSGYTVAKDGLTYTFTLRKNIPFHNGKIMTADDVVSSLSRWARVNPRATPANVESISAAASDTVIVRLKGPYAPFLALMALVGPAIMPKEIADTPGPQPLRQIIGTGPYKLVEWAPDQHVHLTRFDQYAPREEPPSFYAGRKDALADDIYYHPVSQIATRIAGVQSGTYDIADQINADAYAQLAKDQRVDIGTIPGSNIVFFLNTKQGMMANAKMRRALALALDMQPIMRTTFGDPHLYTVSPSFYPKGTPWYTTAGANLYDIHNVEQAKQLAKEAGYSGQPIRWLTTQDYDWIFKSTVIGAAQLQQAGFKVDTQLMDWASVLAHRSRPADWDVFVTGGGFSIVPDPGMNVSFSPTYPGWWDTPTKTALLTQFLRESDPGKRLNLWAQLQLLTYEEVPFIVVGGFSTLNMGRKGLGGFRSLYFIVPWNVQAVR